MFRSILALSLLLAISGAHANPDPDQLGIYFDTDATAVCTTVDAHATFDAWLIITNASAGEINAISCELGQVPPDGAEGALFLMAETLPPQTIMTGDYGGPFGGLTANWGIPLINDGGPVIIAHWVFLMYGEFSVGLLLGPDLNYRPDPSGPYYYAGDDYTPVPLGVSSGSFDLPVAQINGDCSVVAVETTRFGYVKCLYR